MTVQERNQHMKSLNDSTRSLNSVYNVYISKLCDESHENFINENYDIKLCETFGIHCNNETDLFAQINDIVNAWDNNNLIKTSTDPKLSCIHKLRPFNTFPEIYSQLYALGESVGFYATNDAITIISQHAKISFADNKIHFVNAMNSIFIPIKYYVTDESNTNELNELYFRKCNMDIDVLLDNMCELVIDNRYVLKGYFDIDSLNIMPRTSQIANTYIFDKLKEFEEALDEIKYINIRFKRVYIKNLSICDIFSHDVNNFVTKAEEDYDKYGKLIKTLSFRNLMSEFSKDCNNSLLNMYTIIKLLLLGSEDCINFAGLLFGLTKDKKIGSDIISDVIYRNLSFNSQTKLKKSSNSIKNEIEKLKSLSSEDIDIKKQLALCKYMPPNVKKLCLEKIEEMKSGTSEYYKQFTYVKMLMSFPWTSEHEDSQFSDIKNDIAKSKDFLETSKQSLNDAVFGHDECKSTIQEMIATWISNPQSAGKAIGLWGPPGVGKTMIAKSLGKALNLPFAQIILSGQDDGNVLCGHSYTYSAAQPGLILKKIIEAGSSRCILYFDELDKACKKHDSNEIFNLLIHLTDQNTNHEYNDRFFQEINFPLNKVLFVFSYNDPGLIDKILRDRLHEIEVKSYSTMDKLTITNKFLINEICNNIGLNKNDYVVDDEAIEYLVENYTHESGVRDLKRKIESLFSKLNIDKYYEKSEFSKHRDENNKIKITVDLINEYLKKPKMNIKMTHPNNEIGIVSGLYATTLGHGGIIPIMINKNYTGTHGNFVLKITGNQGKVMKESVRYAYITAVNLVKEEIINEFFLTHPYGLHIHNPEGATPKDGPSAGAAFTVAFLSIILNKKIRNTCALTGEIEPTGNITAIGGLQYKLIGAKRSGIKTVFVPHENTEDLDEVKKNNDKIFKDDFKAIIVKDIFDLAKQILIEDESDIDTQFDTSKYLKK
jgi:endopeptidase La